MNREDIQKLLEFSKDFSDVYEIDKNISHLRRLYGVIYTYRKDIKDEVVCQVVNEKFEYINNIYGKNFTCVSANEYEVEIKKVIEFLNEKAFGICLKRIIENFKDKEE